MPNQGYAAAKKIHHPMPRTRIERVTSSRYITATGRGALPLRQRSSVFYGMMRVIMNFVRNTYVREHLMIARRRTIPITINVGVVSVKSSGMSRDKNTPRPITRIQSGEKYRCENEELRRWHD